MPALLTPPLHIARLSWVQDREYRSIIGQVHADERAWAAGQIKRLGAWLKAEGADVEELRLECLPATTLTVAQAWQQLATQAPQWSQRAWWKKALATDVRLASPSPFPEVALAQIWDVRLTHSERQVDLTLAVAVDSKAINTWMSAAEAAMDWDGWECHADLWTVSLNDMDDWGRLLDRAAKSWIAQGYLPDEGDLMDEVSAFKGGWSARRQARDLKAHLAATTPAPAVAPRHRL